MDWSITELVRPLDAAENHFLEVLIDDILLTRDRRSAKLEVRFDSNSPATWNRRGRDLVRRLIPDFDAKADRYQQRLDQFLGDNRPGDLRLNDPEFPFRWASAGALPILRIGDAEYFCLFYREIFPIGWNIANGACDSVTELLDPLCTLERELREELIILDLPHRHWYVLEQHAYPGHRPDITAVEALLREHNKRQKRTAPKLKLADLNLLATPLKWLNGPDSVTVRMGRSKRRIEGCFININALDFGIEIDRVAKLNLDDDVLVCDGEILRGRLLNRLVGLFEVNRMNPSADSTRFIPERFFFNGVAYDGSKFLKVMEEQFVMGLADLRRPHEIGAYQASHKKFDLCPVTRSLLRRYTATAQKQRAPERAVNVFISFGQGDDRLARQVADFMSNVCRKKVFFSPESRSDQTWDRAIDAALDSADALVVVGSSLERLKRRWPEYEYRTFHKDILSGRKPGARMASIVTGIDPVDMPLPLRSYAVEACKTPRQIPIALEHIAKQMFES